MIDLDKAYEFFRSIGEKDAGRDFSLECALIDELRAANAKIERYEKMLSCSECKKTIERIENKFCSVFCKDSFHNELKRIARKALEEGAGKE